MRLSPHVVLETINEFPPHAWRNAQMRDFTTDTLKAAVLFDFGDSRPEVEHGEFAIDLYNRNLFALPYPVTAFASIELYGTARVSFLTVLAVEDGVLLGLVCKQALRVEEKLLPLPLGYVVFESIAMTDGKIDCSARSMPVLAEDRMPPALTEEGGSVMGEITVRRGGLSQYLAMVATDAMGRAVMLMSKGVTTTHEPAPRKLNIARERKGKPSIGDIYTVRINAIHSRTIHTEGGDEDITGHVRGSPRPHWRRGHFRTIHRGAEQERVIPVAPSLIGASDSEVARPMYELAKRGA